MKAETEKQTDPQPPDTSNTAPEREVGAVEAVPTSDERVDGLLAALQSSRAEAEAARAALHDICCEWSEANGAICNETCSTFGHDSDCKATEIAAYLASLRAELEAAKALNAELRAELAEMRSWKDELLMQQRNTGGEE